MCMSRSAATLYLFALNMCLLFYVVLSGDVSSDISFVVCLFDTAGGLPCESVEAAAGSDFLACISFLLASNFRCASSFSFCSMICSCLLPSSSFCSMNLSLSSVAIGGSNDSVVVFSVPLKNESCSLF